MYWDILDSYDPDEQEEDEACDWDSPSHIEVYGVKENVKVEWQADWMRVVVPVFDSEVELYAQGDFDDIEESESEEAYETLKAQIIEQAIEAGYDPADLEFWWDDDTK